MKNRFEMSICLDRTSPAAWQKTRAKSMISLAEAALLEVLGEQMTRLQQNPKTKEVLLSITIEAKPLQQDGSEH